MGPLALEDDDPFADFALLDVAPYCKPSPFSITLYGKTVRFDGESHDSKKRRAYITCTAKVPPGDAKKHNSCCKYKFVTEFGGCTKLCAAWLLAWDNGGRKLAT